MKTERERKLEAALRTISEIDQFSREWLMSNPPQHASCYAAKRIAREALADEDAGGGADHSRDFEGSDPRGMGPLPEEPGNPNPSFEQMENDTPPQQRDALEAFHRIITWSNEDYHHDGMHSRQADTKTVRRALTIPAVPQHPDDAAVDRFADAMKEKMARARQKGRGGWDDPEQCSDSYLATLLVDHLRKWNVGTFEDVANFAMMLHQRGAIPTTLAEAANAAPTVPEAVRRLPDELRQIAARFKETNYERGLYFAIYALDRALAQSGEGRVPEGWRDKLWAIHGALDAALGDSDVDWIESDEELRDEEPVQWAAKELAGLLAAAPEPGPEKNDD